jgi:hypothetical protein
VFIVTVSLLSSAIAKQENNFELQQYTCIQLGFNRKNLSIHIP